MFVISLFARNGFYVVLDNQLNDDPTLINDGESVWLGYWKQIATAVAADQFAVNKVIIDPLNVSVLWVVQIVQITLLSSSHASIVSVMLHCHNFATCNTTTALGVTAS